MQVTVCNNRSGLGKMSEEKGRNGRVVCTCISMLLLLGGVTVLVLWLVYRPEKPQFTVIGAAIYGLNRSTPLMSTAMQFSVVIKNPSRRASIYYDRLSTFVSYRNQAITPQVLLPPLYQYKHSSVSVSPLIGGTPLPEPEEEAYGVMALRLIFKGRLKWKAGAIKTAHYGLYVNCDVLIAFNKGLLGEVPLLRLTPCHVHL